MPRVDDDPWCDRCKKIMAACNTSKSNVKALSHLARYDRHRDAQHRLGRPRGTEQT